MKNIRTKFMSLAMLVGSALWFGGGVAIAQDEFLQEHHYHEGGYWEGNEGGYREGYHFGFRHGFYDGLHGRSYENRTNTRAEYVGYDEGYRRGKEKFLYLKAHVQW
jgi:hypothetical protein